MLTLWVKRRPAEWQLASELNATADQAIADIAHLKAPAALPASLSPARFACRTAETPTLTLRLALADRHIVSRPAMRFRLLEKEQVDIFIGTPLWLQLFDGDRLLCDLPTRVLKSTWFGPDTRTGRLCYATQTAARVLLDDILKRRTGVVTKVTVINRTDRLFIFDRVNIPIPSLTTYSDTNGTIWTEDIVVAHDRDEHATVQLSGTAPALAEGAKLITPARQPAPRSILVRAVEQLRAER